MSLAWRIFLVNGAVLTAAALLLLLGPATVSTPVLVTEAVVLAIGLAVMLIANAVLVHLALAPLQRLARAMRTTDLLRPSPRLAVAAPSAISDLTTAFNTMLDRLEKERATSAGRALSAQEAERHRIAQELHDEVGQTLTAVLLGLKNVADQAPEPLRESMHQVQDLTRSSLDEIRRIARRLRPGVLDELGLATAVRGLVHEFTDHTGLPARCHVDDDLPDLGADAELVFYRVAQESLTNVARHAHAKHVEVTLLVTDDGVELLVRDDGRGLNGHTDGAGIRGMRERALLIGATLAIHARPAGGTQVSLSVPTRSGGAQS
ncbi:MAG TPA: sensor histidine kinase [Micromonosporaceae bacterium]|jgi:two-component system sensor histidine kinase UhpB|nr:sensor histidine kinase [Micromonosporaceae bacterium]